MRHIAAFALATLLLSTAAADAQTIGTFRWQLRPYGSVVNITITQVGSVFELQGFETQCGGNLSLPLTGLAVPQNNGTIFLGFTSINENGGGLHTRAYVTLANLTGTWADNAGNFNQQFFFNPGVTCPGGPRPGPLSSDAELAALRARIAKLEGGTQ
jgi:hypothetical protein